MLAASLVVLLTSLGQVGPAAAASSTGTRTFTTEEDFAGALSATGLDVTSVSLPTPGTVASPAADRRRVAVVTPDAGRLDGDLSFLLGAYFPSFRHGGDGATDDVLQYGEVTDLHVLDPYDVVITQAATRSQATALPQDVVTGPDTDLGPDTDTDTGPDTDPRPDLEPGSEQNP